MIEFNLICSLSNFQPYATIVLIGAFGNRELLTPLVSMVPAFACKIVSCIDPWIYAINHPRYRMEIQKRFPWFCVHEPLVPEDNQSALSMKTATSDQTVE